MGQPGYRSRRSPSPWATGHAPPVGDKAPARPRSSQHDSGDNLRSDLRSSSTSNPKKRVAGSDGLSHHRRWLICQGEIFAMILPITLAFASLNALIFIFLSILVVRGRFKERVSVGAGGKTSLELKIRAHGNFAEYVPLALFLLAL